MVAHPELIRTGKDLHPYIVVAVFQELCALGKIVMALEIVKYVLPCVVAPTVIQQDRFDQVRIQKRRKCITPGVSVILGQL